MKRSTSGTRRLYIAGSILGFSAVLALILAVSLAALNCFMVYITAPLVVMSHAEDTLLQITTSPEGTYTLKAIRRCGGASTGFAVIVTRIDSGHDDCVYYHYGTDEADICWLTDHIAAINGRVLDLSKGESWTSEDSP
ncbi:MAG: hypothetical protein IJZ74_02385 [Clostridia bacterium]|nr:hypothetical protein [Clostridia bacterium]